MLLEEREEGRLGELEAEGFKRDFELVVVDALVFVEVEEAELRGWLACSLCSCAFARAPRVRGVRLRLR